MKQGDFTKVAKFYHNRPAYSEFFIKRIINSIAAKPYNEIDVVEFGAGTGKLSLILDNIGVNLRCVEPNDNMREEGIKYTINSKIKWESGSAEVNGVNDNSANIVLMASSFHWSDPNKSLPEFHRILKDKGAFCCLWNPRDIRPGSVFHKIEEEIKNIVPELNRVSSGTQNTKEWEKVIISTGHFKNVYFMECDYMENMSKERYMGAWQSVNDIQAQAGEARWKEILNMIDKNIKHLDEIIMPYKIRAWIGEKI